MELYKKIVLLMVIMSAIPLLNAMEEQYNGRYPSAPAHKEDEDIQLAIELSLRDGVNAHFLGDAFNYAAEQGSSIGFGRVLQQKGVPIINNGKKYSPKDEKYSIFIQMLDGIIFSTTEVDITKLLRVARFYGATCDIKSKLPWYKKYALPFFGGAALFGAGSLFTYALMKWTR